MTPTAINATALAGRALLASLFIPSGLAKLLAFTSTAGFIGSKGLPLPEVCAALAIAVEVGAGVALLLGWRQRYAAFALGFFVLVITPLFHNYWALPAPQQMLQKQAFFKNLGIIGGLLIIAALGAGGWSVDARASRRSA